MNAGDARRLLALPPEQRRVSYIPSDRPVTGVVTKVGRLYVFVRFDGETEESAIDPANLELVPDVSRIPSAKPLDNIKGIP